MSRFLYQRGHGSMRRVMHLTSFDQQTGEPTMKPLCGDDRLRYDTTCNLPLGLAICKRCERATKERDQP